MDYKEFKKNITHMLQKNIYEEYTIRTENAGENDYLHDTLIITPPSAKYGLTFQWGHLYNRFQCNCDLKAIVALIIQEIMIVKKPLMTSIRLSILILIMLKNIFHSGSFMQNRGK